MCLEGSTKIFNFMIPGAGVVATLFEKIAHLDFF